MRLNERDRQRHQKRSFKSLNHLLCSDMVEIEEGWHSLPDGTELYTKSWKVGSAQFDLAL